MTEVDDIEWFHSIDMGDGVITPGNKSPERLREETIALNLPVDMRGMRALDIGAWDGYFSFEMEDRGAEVTALDYWSWSIDLHEMVKHNNEMLQLGKAPMLPDQHPLIWRPDTLPGMAGFELARARRGSSVASVVGDFMTTDLGTLGAFDLVLFSGVLYHLQDPILALRRLRQVTCGTAIIETAAVVVPGNENAPLWHFLEGAELNDDPSNWWAPNLAGLISACRVAGFQAVEVKSAPDPAAPAHSGYTYHFGRAVVHAIA